MRLRHMILLATVIVLGQAALDAVPVVVAQREGGMGLGSALVVVQLADVAGVALGAIGAAHLVDRGSMRVPLIAGSVLFYGGSIAVGMQPMGALTWVAVALTFAGVGFGAMATVAFAAAAALGQRARLLAIMILLLAPLIARGVILSVLVHAGPVGLTVAGLGVVALSVVFARLAGRDPIVTPSASATTVQRQGGVRTAVSTVFGALVLAVGMVATLAGIDASRVSVALVATSVELADLADFDALDRLRAGLVGAGVAMVAIAAVILAIGRRPGRSVLVAVPAVALAVVGAAGTVAALSITLAVQAAAAGEIPLSGPIASIATASGVAGAAWWMARGAPARVVATAGCSLVAAATAVGLLTVHGPTLPVAALISLGAIAVNGLGGGAAVMALRLVLGEVSPAKRGIAAGTGVAAASFGLALGSMLGIGEATRVATGEAGGIAAGGIVLVAAAVVAILLAGLLPSNRPALPRAQAAGMSGSRLAARELVHAQKDADEGELDRL